LDAWQRKRIKQTIAAADHSEFVASEEIERVFTKYKP
jgi:predicted transcriptional regulator